MVHVIHFGPTTQQEWGMAEVAKLKTVGAEIKEELISSLEAALEDARNGDAQGYSCVVQYRDRVEQSGYFEDRLTMIGALHYSLAKVAK